MSESDTSIGGLLIEVMDAVLYFDKKQVVRSGGVRLNPSEAHMLMCAVDGMSFTEVARRFAITKGAVSQTFARLAAKGVLVVAKDRSRNNSATVTLTPLGRALLDHVTDVRGRLGADLDGRLAGYSEAELATVERFVQDLRAFVRDSLTAVTPVGGPPKGDTP